MLDRCTSSTEHIKCSSLTTKQQKQKCIFRLLKHSKDISGIWCGGDFRPPPLKGASTRRRWEIFCQTLKLQALITSNNGFMSNATQIKSERVVFPLIVFFKLSLALHSFVLAVFLPMVYPEVKPHKTESSSTLVSIRELVLFPARFGSICLAINTVWSLTSLLVKHEFKALYRKQAQLALSKPVWLRATGLNRRSLTGLGWRSSNELGLAGNALQPLFGLSKPQTFIFENYC